MHSFCSLIIKFILIFRASVLVASCKYKGSSGKENTRTIPPFFFFNHGTCSLFLESPGNFSDPESCFVFAVFTFKIKASIIMKRIQWNYQLTKQNWLVCGAGSKPWWGVGWGGGERRSSKNFFQPSVWSKNKVEGEGGAVGPLDPPLGFWAVS